MTDNEKVLQDKSYEFETLRQELARIDEELAQLSDRMASFDNAKSALESLKGTKKGQESIVPIGEGLFIKAAITDVEKVLLSVGSGVVVGKGVDKALDYVAERIDEADKLVERLNANAAYFTQKMRQLEVEIQRLIAEAKRAREE